MGEKKMDYTEICIWVKDDTNPYVYRAPRWYDWEVNNLGVAVKDKEGRWIAFIPMQNVKCVEMA